MVAHSYFQIHAGVAYTQIIGKRQGARRARGKTADILTDEPASLASVYIGAVGNRA